MPGQEGNTLNIHYDKTALEEHQKQQQTLRTSSIVSKKLHDTAMSVIRKIN